MMLKNMSEQPFLSTTLQGSSSVEFASIRVVQGVRHTTCCLRDLGLVWAFLAQLAVEGRTLD